MWWQIWACIFVAGCFWYIPKPIYASHAFSSLRLWFWAWTFNWKQNKFYCWAFSFRVMMLFPATEYVSECVCVCESECCRCAFISAHLLCNAFEVYLTVFHWCDQRIIAELVHFPFYKMLCVCVFGWNNSFEVNFWRRKHDNCIVIHFWFVVVKARTWVSSYTHTHTNRVYSIAPNRTEHSQSMYSK